MAQPGRAISVDMPAEEVARLFEDRDLISAPVIDDEGHLIGRITIDDVVDVIRREADRAVLRKAGLHEEVDLFAPVSTSIRRRAGWLGVHLATAFAAAGVIWLFEATIEEVVALAVLMPVIASMAGVSGNQTLTLVTRGIALAQLSVPNISRLLLLECRVAIGNGLIWALVVTLAAGAWFADLGLGLVFGAALAFSMLGGAIAGTLVPVTMTRFNIDPAIAGGVVLTGITDVVGFGSFLGLAAWLLI
jgi:magnesium transporter